MKLARFNFSCIALLLLLPIFHFSLSNSNMTLDKLEGYEDTNCSEPINPLKEDSKESCKGLTTKLQSKNYSSCCFVKLSKKKTSNTTSSTGSSTGSSSGSGSGSSSSSSSGSGTGSSSSSGSTTGSNTGSTTGSNTGSTTGSLRVLDNEDMEIKYECVRIFRGSTYIQKQKEKYSEYDKIEIECSSKVLKQGLIIGIALVLLI